MSKVIILILEASASQTKRADFLSVTLVRLAILGVDFPKRGVQILNLSTKAVCLEGKCSDVERLRCEASFVARSKHGGRCAHEYATRTNRTWLPVQVAEPRPRIVPTDTTWNGTQLAEIFIWGNVAIH